MKKNRGISDEKKLADGPAKFTMAFGIDKKFNGVNLLDKNSKLKLMSSGEKENFEIIQTNRIGISKGEELQYRFYIKGNKWVSRK
jgi:DNA-3-methyladenine glycosylase